MKKSTCPTIKAFNDSGCNCNYVPPIVKDVLLKKTKDGRYMVKINKKGKWLSAEFNEETKILTFWL